MDRFLTERSIEVLDIFVDQYNYLMRLFFTRRHEWDHVIYPPPKLRRGREGGLVGIRQKAQIPLCRHRLR